MSKSSFAAMAAAAFVAFAVACQQAATSPPETTEFSPPAPSFSAATTFTEILRFPVNIEVFIPCALGGAGETVFLSGNLHSLFHSTVNGNNFKIKIHNQPQGISGLGLTSGDKYQGTGVTRGTFGGSFVNGQWADTFVNNFRIIGQGDGNNWLVHQTFHVTLNANGDLTAFVDNFSSDCK